MKGFRKQVVFLGGLFLFLMAACEACPAEQAVDAAAVQKAVEAGKEFLRKSQGSDGLWVYQPETPEFNIGLSALVGIALLESGETKQDPVIQNVARIVRASAPKLTKTYALALAVMFLDRLNDGQRDVDLIRQLAFRIAAGQDRKTGGWSYDCRPLSATQQLQLQGFLKKNRGPFNFGKGPPDVSHVRGGQGADNSNTQFAILALWVARRRSIPVDHPLLLAEWRFRTTQCKDGGWGYGRDGSFEQVGAPGMTCTGLLALAIAQGLQRERSAQLRSGGSVDGADNTPNPRTLESLHADPAVAAATRFLANRMANATPAPQHTYFLWSLERMAVVYGFNDIQGKDWYGYGSHYILKQQKQDGSWEADNGPVADTCFALMFLTRANIVRDLTDNLSGKANLQVDASPPAEPAEKRSTQLKEIPAAEAEGLAKRLVKELAGAPAARRTEILAELEGAVDRTGHFTSTLAEAIPGLPSEAKEPARAVLTARLARQTARSLKAKLTNPEEDREVRLAAARAAAIKGAPDLISDLVDLLGSKDQELSAATEASLKRLTGQDLGRDPARWRAWLKSKG